MTRIVVVMGSAPDAVRAKQLDCSILSGLVAINNAWKIRPDWTHCIYPEDLPDERRPDPSAAGKHVIWSEFVPANNAFGGIVYAGGTMAFTAGYWALHALKPDILAFIGCDMVYEENAEKSHFYGKGEADPLRDDPTLQSLESKSNRLLVKAAQVGCSCINLSEKPVSRLTFPRFPLENLSVLNERGNAGILGEIQSSLDTMAIEAAHKLEQDAGQYVDSGDYWNAITPLNAQVLSDIDGLWISTIKEGP